AGAYNETVVINIRAGYIKRCQVGKPFCNRKPGLGRIGQPVSIGRVCVQVNFGKGISPVRIISPACLGSTGVLYRSKFSACRKGNQMPVAAIEVLAEVRLATGTVTALPVILLLQLSAEWQLICGRVARIITSYFRYPVGFFFKPGALFRI